MTSSSRIDIDANRDDRGLGLIELIVGLLVSTIVVVAAATVLMNSWITQQKVVATTHGTNSGQVLASMIERAVRNAKDVQVLPSEADGTELRVWTTLGGAKTCQGFLLTTGTARIGATSGSILPATSDWALWDDNVSPFGSAPFIRQAGNTVSFSFELEDVDAHVAPVQLSGEVSIRSKQDGTEVSPCW
jgi:hypothetical protein